MNYSQFLFCMLLGAHNDSFSKLPYDIMYERYKYLYVEYSASEYNDMHTNEYECMENFIKDRDIPGMKFEE